MDRVRVRAPELDGEGGWIGVDDLSLAQLRGRVAMVIVEHHAETVLPLVDRAYVLVNGRVAFEGTARSLEENPELQARLLGVVQKEVA